MKISLSITFLTLALSSCQSLRNYNNSRVSSGSVRNPVNSQSKQDLMRNQAVLNSNTHFDQRLLDEKKLYAELTGKNKKSAVLTAPRVLKLARESKDQKNYINALKRYNLIFTKFPNSTEVIMAYYDKAEIYKEMGLFAQADYNIQQAQLVLKKRKTQKTVKAPIKTPIKASLRAPLKVPLKAQLNPPNSNQVIQK